MINEASKLAATIRLAVAEDADGITRTFLESAEHHASLDSELYFVPAIETITARYREGRQHPAEERAGSITLVAELSGDIVGFIDARLYQPTDAMHRQMIYCLISEIAVSRQHQNHGIGGQLLRAAEDWGRQRARGVRGLGISCRKRACRCVLSAHALPLSVHHSDKTSLNQHPTAIFNPSSLSPSS